MDYDNRLNRPSFYDDNTADHVDAWSIRRAYQPRCPATAPYS